MMYYCTTAHTVRSLINKWSNIFKRNGIEDHYMSARYIIEETSLKYTTNGLAMRNLSKNLINLITSIYVCMHYNYVYVHTVTHICIHLVGVYIVQYILYPRKLVITISLCKVCVFVCV